MMVRKLFLVLGILVACSPLANAYRDQETGTFLTRDPIGYADGPNVYCYVHCNPITRFDKKGLNTNVIGTGPRGVTFSFDTGWTPSDGVQLEMNAFEAGSATIAASVDAVGEATAVSGQFVKGTAVGVSEAVTGQEAAAPQTQAELNGRSLGRAGTKAVGEVLQVAGAAQVVAGSGATGGGVAVAPLTGGVSLSVSAVGVEVAAAGALEVVVGGVLVDNAQSLGLLQMSGKDPSYTEAKAKLNKTPKPPPIEEVPFEGSVQGPNTDLPPGGGRLVDKIIWGIGKVL